MTYNQLNAHAFGPSVISKAHALEDIHEAVNTDMPYTYTAYGVVYAPATSSGRAYHLRPGEIVPIWARQTETATFKTMNLVQMRSWAAVAYEGKLFLANKDPEEQDFIASTTLPGRDSDRLMAPGGRVAVNLLEPFPCGVPFQYTTGVSAPRVFNAMHPQAWASAFLEAPLVLEYDNVASGSIVASTSYRAFPRLRLYAMYDEVSPTTQLTMAGDRSIALPCRALDLPVGFEWAEHVLLEADSGDCTLREAVHEATKVYLETEDLATCMVGLGWEDQVPADVDRPDEVDIMVWRSDFSADDRFASRRMNSTRPLMRLQSGVYQPEM